MSESRAEKSALPLLFFGEVDRYRKRHPFKDLSFYRDYLPEFFLFLSLIFVTFSQEDSDSSF